MCDKEREGNEGQEKEGGDLEDDKGDDDDKKEEKLRRREDKGDGKGKCEDSDNSLRFCGYTSENEGKNKVQTLRLEWRTKYACEDAPPSKDGGSHWGFFGWFFIMYVYPSLSPHTPRPFYDWTKSMLT